MKKTKSLIALIVSLILLVGACSPADTETTAQNAQTTTAAPETDEITTGATVESAEQTEALSREIAYEAMYSGSCDRAALNRIEIGERAVTIFIDEIHSTEEKRYEKRERIMRFHIR